MKSIKFYISFNMLEHPALQDIQIIHSLRNYYGLNAVQVTFFPLGADPNTAVYRIAAEDGKAYFLKLRLGNFDEASVIVPRFLLDQGINQLIAPIAANDHRLWIPLEDFTLILYPFVEGKNAIDVRLSENQWVDFGAALKGIHSRTIPAALEGMLDRETFSSTGREAVKAFLDRVKQESFIEPTAVKTADFLKVKQEEISNLVERTERLALALKERPLEFVLCHSDVFAANLLIDANARIYMVDWDNPILAPKERDLMFIGGGICDVWNTAEESELFYKGYGQTRIDPTALVYYRYERIIQDIAVIAEGILTSDEGGADREQEFGFLKSNFVPNGVLAIAYKTDRDLLDANSACR